jgi:hypothetical protein
MMFKAIWTTKYTYNYGTQFDNYQKCVYARNKEEMYTFIDDDLSKKYRVLTTEYFSLWFYDEVIVQDVNLRQFPNLKADSLSILTKWVTVKIQWVTNIWEQDWYRVYNPISWEYWWINQIGIKSTEAETELSW